MHYDDLTQETIIATREHFANICDGTVEAAKRGEFYVNDLDSLIEWQNTRKKDMLAGKSDKTFTFLQRAWWIQTGNMVGLLG